MHEISMVNSIFKTLEQEFDKEELQMLESIRMKIGAMANIEPTLMQNAFDAVVESTGQYRDVKLIMDLVPVEIYCRKCDHASEVQNYIFKCGECGEPSNNVVKGTEFLIHEVTFA